jgi:hypothetical protein
MSLFSLLISRGDPAGRPYPLTPTDSGLKIHPLPRQNTDSTLFDSPTTPVNLKKSKAYLLARMVSLAGVFFNHLFLPFFKKMRKNVKNRSGGFNEIFQDRIHIGGMAAVHEQRFRPGEG